MEAFKLHAANPRRMSEDPTAPGEAPDDAMADALRCLANPKRLRLLRFLVEPRYLEEIARELGVARQSAQEHVDQLLAAGIIQPLRGKRDHGPVTEYVVVLPRVFDLHEQLGARIGILSGTLEERVHLFTPTAPLNAKGPSGGAEDLPRLTIVHGMRIGTTVKLVGDGPWLLGRDPHATLCLDYDPYASTRHAEVRRTRGGFELADRFSSNGTSLDWLPLPRGGTAPLPHGSLLRIGKTLIHFRAPGRA